MKALVMTTVGALAIGACAATIPPPKAELAQSQANIRAAQEHQAQSVPQARLYLKLARDQLRAAEAMLERGDNADAKRALQRAAIDAQLALVLAKTSTTREAADSAIERIERLRQRG